MAERVRSLYEAFSANFEDSLVYSLNYMAKRQSIEFNEGMIREGIGNLRTNHERRIMRDLARVADAVGGALDEDVVFYMANALAAQIVFTAVFEGRHTLVRTDIDIGWKDYPKLMIWGDVFRKGDDIDF